MQLKLLLNESIKLDVRYTHEHIHSYSDQSNYEIGIYRKDGNGLGHGVLGCVEYTIFNDSITVSNITVLPKYRRLGIGSRLIQYMKQRHPKCTYKPSLKTDLGYKFKHKVFKNKDLYTISL